ncbi:galectin-4-like [Amblyomma americanum]
MARRQFKTGSGGDDSPLFREELLRRRFFISFQCGGHGSDIAFHFSPRFLIKEVVRNSFRNGKWGTEERKTHGFPCAPGVNFDLLIRVLDSCFAVAVNGLHYLQFEHRLRPLQRVTHLSVEGDVDVECCKFEYGQ